MANEQSLLDAIKTHYNISIKIITPLNLGADVEAQTYRAIANDQIPYFIKVKQGHRDDISSRITLFISQAGIHHVIPIIKTTAGKSSLLLNDCTITIFPFIDGKDGFSTELTHTQWQTLGSIMGKIHKLKYPPIDGILRRETYSDKWRQAIRSLDSLLESTRQRDEIALELMSFLHTQRPVLHQLVDQAEELAQKIKKQNAEYILCHADLHAGNILVDTHGKLFILDWDNPILAPKERDLMFIGGGIGNVWNKPDEEALFYQGYGSTTINRDLLAYYRCDRILEDIAIYCHLLLLSTDGGQKRKTWYQELIDQFACNGVIDIALNLS